MTTHAKPVILINEADRIVTTIFEDGATLHAIPNIDDESWARAIALGYATRDDASALCIDPLWRMTKDHERLHHLVAEALDRQPSVALWYAAHPAAQPTAFESKLIDEEERIVLLIQRLLNQGLDA
jgi:23S rRNA A2030 N6-methylase RlmJ